MFGVFYYIEGIYIWDIIFDNYVLFILFLVFFEVLLNGMVIMFLVIY